MTEYTYIVARCYSLYLIQMNVHSHDPQYQLILVRSINSIHLKQ